jgi:hypothetical protein
MGRFLRSPESFDEAVLPAANLGNDAEGAASMAEACAAPTSRLRHPGTVPRGVVVEEGLEGAADELLFLARPIAS